MGRGVGGIAIRLSCSFTPSLAGGVPAERGRWAPASPTCPPPRRPSLRRTRACTPALARPPLHARRMPVGDLQVLSRQAPSACVSSPSVHLTLQHKLITEGNGWSRNRASFFFSSLFFPPLGGNTSLPSPASLPICSPHGEAKADGYKHCCPLGPETSPHRGKKRKSWWF